VAAGADAAASCVATSMDQTVRMTLGGADVVILAQGTAGQANTAYIGFVAPGGTYTSVATNGAALSMTATAQEIFVGNKNGDHVDDLSLPGLAYGPIACTTDCGSSQAVDMATDVLGESVLWITQSGGVLKAPVAVSGSTGTPLAQLPGGLGRMARDGAYVYATSQVAVYAVPLAQIGDAGAFVVLSGAEASQPFGIAADESGVYFTTAGGLVRRVSAPAP
jgi:hypothetical protein